MNWSEMCSLPAASMATRGWRQLATKKRENELKVFVYVDESWADVCGQGFLLLRRCRWPHSNRVKVVEKAGTKRWIGRGKIKHDLEANSMHVIGSFKASSSSDGQKNRKKNLFRLSLTSNVSLEDFRLGYVMSGVVERVVDESGAFKATHLAFVKRAFVDGKMNPMRSFVSNTAAPDIKSTATTLKAPMQFCRQLKTKVLKCFQLNQYSRF